MRLTPRKVYRAVVANLWAQSPLCWHATIASPDKQSNPTTLGMRIRHWLAQSGLFQRRAACNFSEQILLMMLVSSVHF